jgi:hypothetical protein
MNWAYLVHDTGQCPELVNMGNEPSGSVKDDKKFGRLSDCQLLRRALLLHVVFKTAGFHTFFFPRIGHGGDQSALS